MRVQGKVQASSIGRWGMENSAGFILADGDLRIQPDQSEVVQDSHPKLKSEQSVTGSVMTRPVRVGKYLVEYGLLLLLFMIFVTSVRGQGQFMLNIDCGSEKNYTDDATGMLWVTDEGYIKTGQNAGGITVPTNNTSIVNRRQMETLRFFPEKRQRHCYVIPVTPMRTYLLRVGFFAGKWTPPTQGSILIDVYINATNFAGTDFLRKRSAAAERKQKNYESIFYSPGGQLNLCLFSQYPTAFISSLEVRMMAPNMYSIVAWNSILLRKSRRYSAAAAINRSSEPVRYPDDEFDRIWESAPGNPCRHVLTIKENINLSSTTQERPPLKAMQNAWICTNSRIMYFDHKMGASESMIAYGYFQDENVSVSNVRGMDFYVNNNRITRFNTSNALIEISTPVLRIPESSFNFSFRQAPWSRLPPMVNAFEIYSVYDLVKPATATEDGVQRSFNLTDWTGDPCTTIPFEWLQCTEDLSTSSANANDLPKSREWRITKLFLAQKATMTALPPQIAGFTRLTDLNVSGINLSEFPKGLSALNNLTVLDLSNNNLSGSVEEFINSIDYNNVRRLRFNRNKNIGGTLNLSSWHASLLKMIQRDGALVNASAGLLITLTYNNIDSIFPAEDVLTPTIGTLLDSNHNFAQYNGVLLGGNPWCTNKKVKHSSLAREYLCRNSTSYVPESRGKFSSNGSRTAVIVGSTFGTCAFLLCIISLLFARKLRIQYAALREIQDVLAREKVYPPFYSYSDLRAATNNFSKENHLGKGGFGVVYRGKLADGTLVAVKRLLPSNKALSQFLNEMVLIAGIKHRNLVQLKGCCIKEDQRLLVYEYAENGNLADALWEGNSGRGKNTWQPMLDWHTRVKICEGIARGLSYLHEKLQPRIIHRDIKPSNVLIDSAFNAKVADFGLARSFPEYESHVQFTDVAGTLGYLAPEYAIEGHLTDKADVYAFGLVALEIVSGRKCIDHQQPPERISLLTWVRNLRQNGDLLDILDPSVQSASNEDEVRRVIHVACACLNANPSLRPTMSKAMFVMHGQGVCALQLGDIPCSSDEDEDEDELEDAAQSPHPSGCPNTLPEMGSTLRKCSTFEEVALLDSQIS